MGNYKRCPIVFNMDNPMQSDLYHWCMSQTTNFSDFTRSILFAYRQSQTSVLSEVEAIRGSLTSSPRVKSDSASDADAMAGIL